MTVEVSVMEIEEQPIVCKFYIFNILKLNCIGRVRIWVTLSKSILGKEVSHMQTQLRYWEYYGMTETFESLYEDSKANKPCKNLYELIISRSNILLAYRNIKRNKGAMTAGMDGRTILDYKDMSEDELVYLIRKRLNNYRPMKVRRVTIPKPNGKLRPLGIPSISDRIIQQAIKQILEPICEAKFYKYSYGFRPNRATKHALARLHSLVNRNGLYYVVDVDIKGFFDNVNHTRLIKQMWNIGIRDKRVLAIIGKMLKAPIQGEGIPTKGTPQGGILSPLLSNIVLNDLDQWVADQWDTFETQHNYSENYAKVAGLKRTSNMKEGCLVRYADDFKILCRDIISARKWFAVVKKYLKMRLCLEISEEKSKIINLKKSYSEFLGFKFKARWHGKKNKFILYSNISDSRKETIIKGVKEKSKMLHDNGNVETLLNYNAWILGIHNYFNSATHAVIDFKEINHKTRHYTYNKLRPVAKHGKAIHATDSYKKFYSTNIKTFSIQGRYLYPISEIRHKTLLNFPKGLTPYTREGRDKILKNLKDEVREELYKLNKIRLYNGTVEYKDNWLSRYSMKNGKCEITGIFLTAHEVHCHHFLPKSLGGTDKFDNLRIVSISVHKLIHATDKNVIEKYVKMLNLDKKEINKINSYRNMCKLEPIKL